MVTIPGGDVTGAYGPACICSAILLSGFRRQQEQQGDIAAGGTGEG